MSSHFAYFSNDDVLPPRGLAAQHPVSRKHFTHLTAALGLLSNCSAASRREAPLSTRAMTLRVPTGRNGKDSLERREVRIPPLGLTCTLCVPTQSRALIVFAHGSGSSRLSPRNNAVADSLNADGMATLLFDLLTEGKESNRANVFDIPLLAGRLADAVRWLGAEPLVARWGCSARAPGRQQPLLPPHS